MRKITYIIAVLMLAGLWSCSTSRYYHLKTVEFKDLDYGYPIKMVKVKNINIATIDEGKSQKVLLLIHGLGSNAKAWIKNIPKWSKEYRVIAVDLPGYFKSDKDYYEYSMEFYARVLTDLLSKLNIEKATFIGHSMGGQIALVTALEYPSRVENLVLVSPAGFEKFTIGEGEWMINAVTPEFVKATGIRNIAVNLKSNFYNAPADAEFMITDRIAVRKAKGFDDYCYAVSKNVRAMIDSPVYDRLEEIKQPTLIIFGQNDKLIPNAYLHGGWTKDIAKIGNDKIPNSTLFMVPECGHFAQFEKADKVNEAIIKFLH